VPLAQNVMPPYFEASNGQPLATSAASAAPQPVKFMPVTCMASMVPFAPPATGMGGFMPGVTVPELESCEKSQWPAALVTPAVVNVALPSSALAIASLLPSPAGNGQGQLTVGQHIFEPSHVDAVVPPAPPVLVVAPEPPVLVEAPEPPLELLEPAVLLLLPAEPRLSLPLPPHAEAKAAAPESTNTAAHKLDFEVVRMGSTDHLGEHSSQCTELIPTFI